MARSTLFGVDGLHKYGYAKESSLLKNKMLNNCEGLNKPGISIRENYYPLTGEGLNAEKGKYKKTSTPDSDPVIDNKSSDLARRPIGATIKSKAPVNGSCSVNSCFF